MKQKKRQSELVRPSPFFHIFSFGRELCMLKELGWTYKPSWKKRWRENQTSYTVYQEDKKNYKANQIIHNRNMLFFWIKGQKNLSDKTRRLAMISNHKWIDTKRPEKKSQDKTRRLAMSSNHKWIDTKTFIRRISSMKWDFTCGIILDAGILFINSIDGSILFINKIESRSGTVNHLTILAWSENVKLQIGKPTFWCG